MTCLSRLIRISKKSKAVTKTTKYSSMITIILPFKTIIIINQTTPTYILKIIIILILKIIIIKVIIIMIMIIMIIILIIIIIKILIIGEVQLIRVRNNNRNWKLNSCIYLREDKWVWRKENECSIKNRCSEQCTIRRNKEE